MPNIHDVAKKAGVSTATVSRTFRTPGLLSAETQQRVLEASRLLNYRPRGKSVKPATAPDGPLLGRIHETIGFQFFADRPRDTLQTNSFYAPMLMGAQEAASKCGLNLMVHVTDRHQLTAEFPKMVQERAISGMLLVGTSSDPATLSLFADRVPHLVLLDNRDPQGRYESIVSDGFGGAFAATEYLLKLGHRRIGFFLAEEETPAFQERFHGYISALLHAGITPDPKWVMRNRFEDSDEVRQASFTALMAPADRPTALLVANDDYAFATMRVLREMGYSIPRDISLIGFDDISFCTHTDPPLTTVRVNKEGMGRLAVQRLFSALHRKEGEHLPVVENRVPVSLVVRQSCRPID